MDLNPYKSPVIEAGKDHGTWFRRRPATAQEKQRAIRVLVAIDCGVVAYGSGNLAFYCFATFVLPIFAGNGSGGIGIVGTALVLMKLMQVAMGITGGISGYLLAGRFLSADERVAWKLSLVGAGCFGMTTLLAAWLSRSAAVLLVAAIAATVVWAAIPHLLKAKQII
jgi:hypothetical protein